MEITEMLCGIRGELTKDGGKWDLTDDNGEPIVYDAEKGVNIPDLTLNKDNEVCAVIPLGYFSDETVEKIYFLVKPVEPDPDTKIICSRCGSMNVTCDAVINPNTKEFKDYGSDAFEYGNCNDCDNSTYLVDVIEVRKKLQLEYDEFLSTMGREPEILSCQVVRKEPNDYQDVRVQLCPGNRVGDDIFFKCNGFTDLKRLTEFGNEDFIISWVYNFQ